jgi:hypothetical protein
MKPASAKPAPGHHRCLYLSTTGRQCRNWVLDPRGMCCPRHSVAQPHGPDDYSFHLLNRACNFENAAGIHESIRRLYSLLAADAISPRRAAVLGYLTSLLLRTLPAVYKDPPSAAQLSEREKAKSLAASASKPTPALTQKPTPTQQSAPTKESVPTQNPAFTDKIAPQRSAQPAPQPPARPMPQLLADPAPPLATVAAAAPPTIAASTPDHLGKGIGPMPATRAEFAAQVLKRLASTPPTPAAPISAKPNPTALTSTAINQTDQELRSSAEPPPSKPTSKMTGETASQTISQSPSELVNQPTDKKSYQVRLHTNMPITGSEPRWGWTTNP